MEKIDRALAKRIINICRIETEDKNLTERSILRDVGIDSIAFVKILFAIETIEKLDFSADIPLMSECETIHALIKKVQSFKNHTRERNE